MQADRQIGKQTVKTDGEKNDAVVAGKRIKRECNRNRYYEYWIASTIQTSIRESRGMTTKEKLQMRVASEVKPLFLFQERERERRVVCVGVSGIVPVCFMSHSAPLVTPGLTLMTLLNSTIQ